MVLSLSFSQEEKNCTQRQGITRANYSTETGKRHEYGVISILNGRVVWTHIDHCFFTVVERRHPLRPKPMKDLYLRPVRTQLS